MALRRGEASRWSGSGHSERGGRRQRGGAEEGPALFSPLSPDSSSMRPGPLAHARPGNHLGALHSLPHSLKGASSEALPIFWNQ